MNGTQNQTESTANREIFSSRVLQAPREEKISRLAVDSV